MKEKFILTIFLLPLFSNGQEISTVKTIDSIIAVIANDPSIIRKLYDTVSYEKEDGTNYWDSSYNHSEYFYKDGQLVKIVKWTKYGNWRMDILTFYHKGKPIKYAEGESFKGDLDYGNLNFEIYYYRDKDIKVTWLTPKPNNVVGLGVDIFLERAYSLQKTAR